MGAETLVSIDCIDEPWLPLLLVNIVAALVTSTGVMYFTIQCEEIYKKSRWSWKFRYCDKHGVYRFFAIQAAVNVRVLEQGSSRCNIACKNYWYML